MVRPVHDPDNRLGAWNSASGRCVTPAITWDQDGNLVNDGTHAYSWNARNRLSSITGYGTSYIYDALGRRLSTTKGGTTTSNVSDVANLLQEARSGAVIANLFNGLGTDKRFSRTVVSTGGTASYLTDTLGSTVALANGGGTVVTNYAYDPYGVTTSSGTANTSTYQYTGRENDGTGLYYDRARYYNPAWGRFISEDPIGFGGGINKYAYTENSPLNFRDPYGTCPTCIVGGVVGGLSAAQGAYAAGDGAGGIAAAGLAGAAAGAVTGLIAPEFSSAAADAVGGLAAAGVEAGFNAASGALGALIGGGANTSGSDLLNGALSGLLGGLLSGTTGFAFSNMSFGGLGDAALAFNNGALGWGYGFLLGHLPTPPQKPSPPSK